MKKLLIIIALFFMAKVSAQKPTQGFDVFDCWIVYYSDLKLNELADTTRGHAIKPGITVLFNTANPGTYTFSFLDVDKGSSGVKIYDCSKYVTINVYNGEGRLKVSGPCQVNYLVLAQGK